MNTTDYLIQFALIAIVVRQIHGEILTVKNLLMPLVLIAGTGAYYLKSFPTAGHDVALVVALGSIGAVIGGLCGLTTHLTHKSEGVFAKAGVAAAGLWVGGMALRLGFSYAADHGYGTDIAKFSRDNDITSSSAWVAAFVTMAVVQSVVRIMVVRVRAARIASAGRIQWAASVA